MHLAPEAHITRHASNMPDTETTRTAACSTLLFLVLSAPKSSMFKGLKGNQRCIEKEPLCQNSHGQNTRFTHDNIMITTLRAGSANELLL